MEKRMLHIMKNDSIYSQGTSSVSPLKGSNSSLSGIALYEEPVLCIFEISVVIVSLAIVSTSSLVIHHIVKVKEKKSRTDFIFIILSASDIMVGLITVPINGIYWYFIVKERTLPSLLSSVFNFFRDFPYYFSYLITAVIAVDRLLVIALDQKYKEIIKRKVLKEVIIALFLFTITYSAVCVYFMKLDNPRKDILKWLGFGYYIMGLSSGSIIILAYFYILYFVWKSSNLTKSGNHFDRKCKKQRLARTIMYLLISQWVCMFPYSIFWMAVSWMKVSFIKLANIEPWLSLLRNCQCFCNAIILINSIKKEKQISKQVETRMVLIKHSSIINNQS